MEPIAISGLIIAPVILATLFFYIFWKLCKHYCRNDSPTSPLRRSNIETIYDLDRRRYEEIRPPTIYSSTNEYLVEPRFSSGPTTRIVPNSAPRRQQEHPVSRVDPPPVPVWPTAQRNPALYSIVNEDLVEPRFHSRPTNTIVPNSRPRPQPQPTTSRINLPHMNVNWIDPPPARRTNPPAGKRQPDPIRKPKLKGKVKVQKAKPQISKSKIKLQNAVDQRIAILQGSLRDSDETKRTEAITEVQKLLLQTLDTSLTSERCRLVIGVDATPAAQAGYCVNLMEKSLSYYVIHKDQLPWQLHDSEDPSEFEMKNLMFALTLWENEIVKGEKVRIYTDNFAITKLHKFDKNQYGERAYNVLQHFEKCKNVTVLNSRNMAVNKNTNLELFARYIQPADDLSRFHIDEAVKFLTELYGISKENVRGTHCKDKRRPQTQDGRPWYRPNERYREILRCAQTSINRSICDKCSRADLLQSSLRIAN